jgi:drug/metabolite transporter (DMT)-like permease
VCVSHDSVCLVQMIAVLLEWIVMGAFPGFKALSGCLLTVVGVVLVTQTKGEDSNPDTNALLALHLPHLPDIPHIDISPGILCSLIAATS